MSETERAPSPRPAAAGTARKRPPNPADAAKIVRRYLSALDTAKPGRSLRRTAEAVASRIVKIDELIVSADPLTRLHLTQERIDLHAEHVRLTTAAPIVFDDIQNDFIRVARAYGERYGITFAAWRQIGVDVAVLEQAGIHRSRAAARPDRPGPPVVTLPAPAASVEPDPAPAAADPPADDVSEATAALATEPASETLWEVESDEDAPSASSDGNGSGSHDSPPMRRKRLGDVSTDD